MKKKIQPTNKKIIILLVLIIALSAMLMPLETYCADTTILELTEKIDENVVTQLDDIDFSNLQSLIDDFNEQETDFFTIKNVKSKVYSIISGEEVVNYSSFATSLFSNIIRSIVKYLPLMSVIVGIGVVSNLMNGIKSKFNEKSTSNLIHLVSFLAVVIMIIAIIGNLSKSSVNAIENMVKQMNIIFPLLLTFMVALGGVNTVGVFQPVVAILTTYVADVFNYYIMPLFILSFVFSIISNLSDDVKLTKFNSFISSLFKWSVGIVFTLFFAVFAVQGITAKSFDSIGLRTTKYTIKSYVPIMGGYLADGMDLIMSSTVLIKNSVGLIGVLMLISSIISPLLEIVICSLMLKLLSAVIEPLGNSKISNFLSSTSKSITILSSSIIAIGFMYLVSMGLLMSISGAAL